MHRRKKIREEIVQILKDNVSSVADSSIYESRIEPIFDHAVLPAICVYTKEESNETFNDHHKVHQRVLELAVEMLVRGDSNVDDSIDSIAEEIENALCSGEHERSVNYQAIELTRTEIGFSESGRYPKAAARLSFSINYDLEFN